MEGGADDVSDVLVLVCLHAEVDSDTDTDTGDESEAKDAVDDERKKMMT